MIFAIAISAMTVSATSNFGTRQCSPPALSLTELTGLSPRETHSFFEPRVGLPIIETNQLADGSTFAKLDFADQQENVMQRYLWGDAGTLDVYFDHGRSQVVIARLDDSGNRKVPCEPWTSKTFAKWLGTPKIQRELHPSEHSHSSLIYEEWKTQNPKGGTSKVRVRCQKENRCMELTLYLPTSGQQHFAQNPAMLQNTIQRPIIEPTSHANLVPGVRRPLHSSSVNEKKF